MILEAPFYYIKGIKSRHVLLPVVSGTWFIQVDDGDTCHPRETVEGKKKTNKGFVSQNILMLVTVLHKDIHLSQYICWTQWQRKVKSYCTALSYVTFTCTMNVLSLTCHLYPAILNPRRNYEDLYFLTIADISRTRLIIGPDRLIFLTSNIPQFANNSKYLKNMDFFEFSFISC